jgi:hypothetical protein
MSDLVKSLGAVSIALLIAPCAAHGAGQAAAVPELQVADMAREDAYRTRLAELILYSDMREALYGAPASDSICEHGHRGRPDHSMDSEISVTVGD